MLPTIYRRLIWAGIILVAVTLVGTFGYWFIANREYTLMDAFYMTFITIATIGYGEIIDLSHNTGGRLFTVFISIAGIGTLAYVATNITAFLVEGELRESFRRIKMENRAKEAREHYIVCGAGAVGLQIVNELHATARAHVVIDIDSKNADKGLGQFKDEIILEGDATENEMLMKAGIQMAKGLFAVTDDDNQNLVICLTARQLNPGLRIVTRCNEPKNTDKMSKAGADAVVSPTMIGGLRMASEMIRPAAVSFLDIMLRDKEKNLRIEDVSIPASFTGKSIASLGLKKYRHVLLLAVRTKNDWIYNPPDDYLIGPADTLVVMADVEGQKDLAKFLAAAG